MNWVFVCFVAGLEGFLGRFGFRSRRRWLGREMLTIEADGFFVDGVANFRRIAKEVEVLPWCFRS